MLNVKDHKTLYMFDPFEYLGPKRRKMLNDSWAGVFRDHVRHEDYRFRAGAEATMSEFDRRTGVKKLRVRGIKAVGFVATLKAAALNILRAGALRKRRNKAKSPIASLVGSTIELIRIIKEQFFVQVDNFCATDWKFVVA